MSKKLEEIIPVQVYLYSLNTVKVFVQGFETLNIYNIFMFGTILMILMIQESCGLLSFENNYLVMPTQLTKFKFVQAMLQGYLFRGSNHEKIW